MALDTGAGARSRGHAVAGRVVVCALTRGDWRGRAVVEVVARRLLELRARRVHDCDVDGCGSRQKWLVCFERGKAQAGACSPWNAQTEGVSPCAVAEEGGCEGEGRGRGSSSSARRGKENPGLTAAHLVSWSNGC